MTIENVRGSGFARDEYGIIDLTGPLNRAILADGSLARTGGYQHEDDEIQVLGLTAFIIIDSLGRKWNALLHPRDRKGRFIETFAEIRAFLKGMGSTKADFTGRTVAMDPDGTAIVQVRGGRGKYASLRNQLVRVPMDKLETVEYKARIGQPAPRALDAPRRSRAGEVAKQTGQTFRHGKPTDELVQIERIAEAAEKAELLDIRDEMLEAKRYIRQEPSNDEVLGQAKALLPSQPESDQIPLGGVPEAPEPKARRRSSDDDTGVPASEPGGAEEGRPEGSRAVREDGERRGELPEPVARPAVAPPGGGGGTQPLPE